MNSTFRNPKLRIKGKLFTSCAQFLFRRSILKTALPMLPQLRWPDPNLGYSSPVQSIQCRFGAAQPFAREFDGSNSLPRDVASRQWQRHLKIPNGGGAFLNAATKTATLRIRIYSCMLLRFYFSVFRKADSLINYRG